MEDEIKKKILNRGEKKKVECSSIPNGLGRQWNE
jgi:hypothetical protein